MLSLDYVKKVKDREQQKWLDYSSVTGVDIGNKIRRNSRNNKLSIRVFVKEKESYNPDEEIPKKVA